LSIFLQSGKCPALFRFSGIAEGHGAPHQTEIMPAKMAAVRLNKAPKGSFK